MATHESLMNANSIAMVDPVRPLANFPPSIWGDRFLSFSIDNLELKTYAKAIEKPKQELRRLIIDPSMDSNAKLSLINFVYRLGLTYLFEEEIEGQLDKLFKDLDMKDYDEADLYTTSVNFQVFRQHGYKLSCDVFNKFKDHNSHKFKEYITNDVKGMLSFYESTQLRIRGESILDEAFAFTEAQLKGIADALDGNLAVQVKHALRSPFHRGLRMVEARLYFSNYKEECYSYESLPKLANEHFRYLQLLHKQELQCVTKWGKDMKFRIITPYARDRIPDLYLWALGLFHEPCYSQARIITTKMTQLVCLLDDTYDAYATIDELRLLTDAINRWDFSALERLPEYMKPLYKILLNEHTELEKHLCQKGKVNSTVDASKQAFQELAKGYLQEAEWRHSRRVPSFQEYLKNGLITSTYNVFLKSILMGMGEIVSEQAFTWFESHPKILEPIALLGRLYNDVASFQFERKRAQQQITSIDTYMKTFGVPENEALDELKKIIENTWKDTNEGCLEATQVSKKVITRMVNLARMTDVVYRYNDVFTFPEKTIEEYITLLFISFTPLVMKE